MNRFHIIFAESCRIILNLIRIFCEMEKSDTTVAGFAAAVEPGVADYREEIAVLKETLVMINSQLKSEKERADVAAFGKEKLLLVSKSLISKVKALRTKDLPEEYNSKVCCYDLFLLFLQISTLNT